MPPPISTRSLKAMNMGPWPSQARHQEFEVLNLEEGIPCAHRLASEKHKKLQDTTQKLL